jgi:predicted nucleic acid-binding protein
MYSIAPLPPGGTGIDPTSSDSAALPRLGFLRHFTNAATMKGSPLTNRQAWKTFEALLADERVRFLPEWPALDGLFKTYSNVNQAAANLWGDAYLAAYAAMNGATVVTFDKGLARYPVKSLILKPA